MRGRKSVGRVSLAEGVTRHLFRQLEMQFTVAARPSLEYRQSGLVRVIPIDAADGCAVRRRASCGEKWHQAVKYQGDLCVGYIPT